MNQPIQKERPPATLLEEYNTFIAQSTRHWKPENVESQYDSITELLPAQTVKKDSVAHIKQRAAEMKPIAEAWWKERGYGITWPQNEADAMKINKLPDS